MSASSASMPLDAKLAVGISSSRLGRKNCHFQNIPMYVPATRVADLAGLISYAGSPSNPGT